MFHRERLQIYKVDTIRIFIFNALRFLKGDPNFRYGPVINNFSSRLLVEAADGFVVEDFNGFKVKVVKDMLLSTFSRNAKMR